jgi:hypothetical protein
MLPFDLPLVSQIGLQFLELGCDVSTVCLINQSGQEDRTMIEQGLNLGFLPLDDRGIEAFECIWICLERQDKELLVLPIRFLSRLALDLLRDPEQDQ